MNGNSRMSTVDRLMDLAKRNGVSFELRALQSLLDDPGYDTAKAAEESAMKVDQNEDEAFKQLLDESMARAEEEAEDDSPVDRRKSKDEETEEDGPMAATMASKILNMTISEKMRLAMLGSSAERDYLIKDNNRLVHMAAVMSPKVRVKDVKGWSGNRLMPDNVLSFIAGHRRYRRMYDIVVNLANNPKTPIKDALRLLPQLVAKDIKALAKNRNVGHQIRRQAKAIIDARDKKMRETMSAQCTFVVIDSVGIGELPDAADYGDVGSDTLGHIAEHEGGLSLPNLQRLGLGNIARDTPLLGCGPVSEPSGAFGKMAEKAFGKDTATGHWEFMGLVLDAPFKTFPNGFPPEIVDRFLERIGRPRALGNKAASGTVIIQELGPEAREVRRPDRLHLRGPRLSDRGPRGRGTDRSALRVVRDRLRDLHPGRPLAGHRAPLRRRAPEVHPDLQSQGLRPGTAAADVPERSRRRGRLDARHRQDPEHLRPTTGSPPKFIRRATTKESPRPSTP